MSKSMAGTLMKVVTLLVMFGAFVATRPVWAQDEGIQVHGHWAIEVLNTDGSVARSVEFQNAYDPGATEKIMVPIFVGRETVESWIVYLSNSGICEDEAGNPQDICVTREGTGTDNLWVWYNLQVTGDASGIVLQGSVTATYEGQATGVMTLIRPTNAGYNATFTSSDLPEPVPVQAGQVVTVKVTFTFS